MSDRRSFLGAVSGVAATSVFAGAADAQPAPTAPPAPPAGPLPSPSASPKPPSAEASAVAQRMRQFDPQLSDTEVTQIAAAVDARRSIGARLNPNKATTLKNGDEPVTRFRATGTR